MSTPLATLDLREVPQAAEFLTVARALTRGGLPFTVTLDDNGVLSLLHAGTRRALPHRATKAPSSDFGAAVLAKRMARGLTQQSLADAIGTARNNIANWERGRVPPPELQKRVLAYLDGKEPTP